MPFFFCHGNQTWRRLASACNRPKTSQGLDTCSRALSTREKWNEMKTNKTAVNKIERMGRTCNPLPAQIDGLVEAAFPRITLLVMKRPTTGAWCCFQTSSLHLATALQPPPGHRLPLANFFALTLVKKPGSSPSPFNRRKKFVCFVRACSPNMSWSSRSRFLFLHVRHHRGQTQSKSWSRRNKQCGVRWITTADFSLQVQLSLFQVSRAP